MRSIYQSFYINLTLHSCSQQSVRYSSNVYLEGPFFTRLSSQLSHTAKIRDGLGLGPDSLSALNAARNDLVHWMGLNNEEGVAPEVISSV